MASSTSSTQSNASHQDSLAELLSVARTVLQQAVDILDNQILEDSQILAPSRLIPGSTIGKHLRHARDHFELLADSVSHPPPYVLCYDTRIRNTPMETSRSASLDALTSTIKRLEVIVPKIPRDETITLEAVTPHMQVLQTTFGRELWFVVLHCVHHWSMVRVIAGELNITVPEDFGFAPSTLVYHGKSYYLETLNAGADTSNRSGCTLRESKDLGFDQLITLES